MSIPGRIDYDAEVLLQRYGWVWVEPRRGFKPAGMSRGQIEEWRRDKGTTIVIDFTTLEDLGLAAQRPGTPLSVDYPEVKRRGLKQLEERLKRHKEERSRLCTSSSK